MILTTPQSVPPVHLFFGAPGLTSSYLVSLMHLARNTAEENKQTHSLHAVSLHASCVSFHAVFVFPGTAHCPLVTQAAAQTPHFPHCQHLFRYWVLLSQLPEYIIIHPRSSVPPAVSRAHRYSGLDFYDSLPGVFFSDSGFITPGFKWTPKYL